jgi:hypothetical protein
MSGPTRVPGPSSASVKLDTTCITASCLHGLARVLDRFVAQHAKMGGAAPDEPCLTEIGIDRGTVWARVVSGVLSFRLVYKAGEWTFF